MIVAWSFIWLRYIRLYKLSDSNKIYYTATSSDYSYNDKIRIIKGEYDLINNSFSFASNFYNLINVEEIYKNNKLFYEDEYILNLITNGIINNKINITYNKYQNPLEIFHINV